MGAVISVLSKPDQSLNIDWQHRITPTGKYLCRSSPLPQQMIDQLPATDRCHRDGTDSELRCIIGKICKPEITGVGKRFWY